MAFFDPAVRSASGIQTSSLLAQMAGAWRQFIAVAFDPYRPEQHYMRGPGPAWRAKHQLGPASVPGADDARRAGRTT